MKLIGKPTLTNVLFGVALAGLAATQAGCLATPAYSGGLPTIQFPNEKATGENANNIVRNIAIETRQIADDWNMIWLMDAPSRMSRWNLR